MWLSPPARSRLSQLLIAIKIWYLLRGFRGKTASRTAVDQTARRMFRNVNVQMRRDDDDDEDIRAPALNR